MEYKLREILATVLEERGLHKDAADFRDGDKAPVAMEAMRRAYALGRATAAPGHTDMMVTPESIDKFLAENPLPEQS